MQAVEFLWYAKGVNVKVTKNLHEDDIEEWMNCNIEGPSLPDDR